MFNDVEIMDNNTNTNVDTNTDTSTNEKPKSKLSTAATIAIIVPVVIVVCILIFIGVMIARKIRYMGDDWNTEMHRLTYGVDDMLPDVKPEEVLEQIPVDMTTNFMRANMMSQEDLNKIIATSRNSIDNQTPEDMLTNSMRSNMMSDEDVRALAEESIRKGEEERKKTAVKLNQNNNDSLDNIQNNNDSVNNIQNNNDSLDNSVNDIQNNDSLVESSSSKSLVESTNNVKNNDSLVESNNSLDNSVDNIQNNKVDLFGETIVRPKKKSRSASNSNSQIEKQRVKNRKVNNRSFSEIEPLDIRGVDLLSKDVQLNIPKKQKNIISDSAPHSNILKLATNGIEKGKPAIIYNQMVEAPFTYTYLEKSYIHQTYIYANFHKGKDYLRKLHHKIIPDEDAKLIVDEFNGNHNDTGIVLYTTMKEIGKSVICKCFEDYLTYVKEEDKEMTLKGVNAFVKLQRNVTKEKTFWRLAFKISAPIEYSNIAEVFVEPESPNNDLNQIIETVQQQYLPYFHHRRYMLKIYNNNEKNIPLPSDFYHEDGKLMTIDVDKIILAKYMIQNNKSITLAYKSIQVIRWFEQNPKSPANNSNLLQLYNKFIVPESESKRVNEVIVPRLGNCEQAIKEFYSLRDTHSRAYRIPYLTDNMTLFEPFKYFLTDDPKLAKIKYMFLDMIQPYVELRILNKVACLVYVLPLPDGSKINVCLIVLENNIENIKPFVDEKNLFPRCGKIISEVHAIESKNIDQRKIRDPEFINRIAPNLCDLECWLSNYYNINVAELKDELLAVSEKKDIIDTVNMIGTGFDNIYTLLINECNRLGKFKVNTERLKDNSYLIEIRLLLGDNKHVSFYVRFNDQSFIQIESDDVHAQISALPDHISVDIQSNENKIKSNTLQSTNKSESIDDEDQWQTFGEQLSASLNN